MNRSFWFLPALLGVLLAPTGAQEASSSRNVGINVTKSTETIGFSPTSLTFASQNTGTSSAAQTITATSTGNAAIPISSVALSGTNASSFSQTNNCPTSLAPNATCTINVVFAPAAAGALTASVVVSQTGGGTYTVGLTGTGTAPPPPVAAFYVATNGKNTNAGTLAAPFLTLAKCQTAMQASSTIKTCYIRAGTYQITSEMTFTSSDNGETWETYSGDVAQSAVIVNNAICNMFWVAGANNVTFTNLTFNGGSAGGGGTTCGALLVANSSTNIYITNNLFQNNSNEVDALVYNSDYVYVQLNTSNLNEYQFFTGQVTDGQQHNHWFVTDNNLSNFSRFGIETSAPVGDFHIDRNTITPPSTNTNSIAISAVGWGAAICGTVWGNTINGNPSSGASPQWGIETQSQGPATTSLENNVINNVAAPFFISIGNGIEISNNTITNFGQDSPYNNYAYTEDGGYSGTEWIGTNTLNSTSVAGWTGHTYGAKPTACAPSAVP
jgi:hypothetical protein